ncbi:MAG: tetratricopeptide repeat protein [Magnetococcales bacterium]|nr:tetratricopeptide repeat protein [Magnetococcales bacterium]MBF0321632.1 tetratricopeptide repeat protein [Magnetococcales bacterium]
MNQDHDPNEWLLKQGNQASMQGDHEGALNFYRQALEGYQGCGDNPGEATTLHQMALLAVHTDDAERAMVLFRHAMELRESQGDLEGMANTLANMAFVSFKAKDYDEAIRLNLQAITALERADAWSDLVTVVNNHAFIDKDAIRPGRAQALWLALRVPVTPDVLLNRCAEMLNELGPESPGGLLIAAGAPLLLLRCKGNELPNSEERAKALLLLAACADAREIPPEELDAWLSDPQWHDVNQLLPALNHLLESLVGSDDWLFDPSSAPPPWWLGKPH